MASSILDDNRSFYEILGVEKSASTKQIRRAYRLLALRVHPDRNQGNEKATQEFQRLGLIHETLTNERSRKRYDRTGKIDEDASAEFETAYEHYRTIFREITKEDIDVYAKKYRFSDEEKEDVFSVYTEAKGDMQVVMDTVPLSTADDLDRFCEMISEGIKAKTLKFKKQFNKTKNSVTFLDDESEAAEAEQARKDLEASGDKMDTSEDSLKALILKRQANRSSFLDSLEEKYANQNKPPPGVEKKSRKKNQNSTKKKANAQKRKSPSKKKKKGKSSPYDMDDAEFEKIRAGLDKTKRKKAKK